MGKEEDIKENNTSVEEKMRLKEEELIKQRR